MRSRVLVLGYFISLFLLVTSVFAQDPLSGTWSGDWGPGPGDRNEVTLSLKWEGKALTGNVTGGENVGAPIPIQKGAFDPNSGKVHMEAVTKNPRSGQTVHFVIDGRVDKGTMTGSWNHDNRNGDFKLTKK
jgi:hypothetical protein